MFDYTNDPKLLETAFVIVADNDFVGHCFHVNGCDFYPGRPNDDALLKLLAQTPARVKIEELRDILNAVLDKPDSAETMTEKKAIAEMEMAKEIIDRHVDLGWLLGYHHESCEGFNYRYASGRYEKRLRMYGEHAA